jgi:hypothetical protein
MARSVAGTPRGGTTMTPDRVSFDDVIGAITRGVLATLSADDVAALEALYGSVDEDWTEETMEQFRRLIAVRVERAVAFVIDRAAEQGEFQVALGLRLDMGERIRRQVARLVQP